MEQAVTTGLFRIAEDADGTQKVTGELAQVLRLTTVLGEVASDRELAELIIQRARDGSDTALKLWAALRQPQQLLTAAVERAVKSEDRSITFEIEERVPEE